MTGLELLRDLLGACTQMTDRAPRVLSLQASSQSVAMGVS